MNDTTFEWDEPKDHANQHKHGVSFTKAQQAFADPHRLIRRDLTHSVREERFFCMGLVGDEIMTVRFTMRGHNVRIIGAGYWRLGRSL